MKRIKILSLLMGLAALFTTYENNENEGPEGPEPREQVGCTALVYTVGDSGVSELSSLFEVDFSDMKADMEEVNRSKCNLTVYGEMVDDVPHLTSLKRENGKIVASTLSTYDEQDPLDKEAMVSVIPQTVSHFLAGSYGFAFLSRNSSRVPVSNNTSSYFTGYHRRTQTNTPDSRETLSSAFLEPLKLVLSDLYNMQSVEIAYEFRDHVEHFVGPPTEIPGPDAPYKAVAPEMFAETNLVTNIVETYYGCYEKSYTGVAPTSNENWTGGAATSVIKSAALDDLVAATKTIIPKRVQEKREVDRSDILAYDLNDDANYNPGKLIQSLTDGVDDTDCRS